MNESLKEWLIERGGEPSTWRGLTWIASSLGIIISPEIASGIAATGMAVSGLIGACSRG